MKNSTQFAKLIEICARKLERIWQVDHQLCLRGKLLWTKLLSEIHQISANQLLELTPASSILIQGVKTCQHDCTQDGSLIPICKNARLDINDLKALRLRRCLTTKKQEQNAELNASTHLEIKKIVCFNVDGYCDHCKTVFEAMGCYYHFVLDRRLVPHLARKILREEKKWERLMIWDVSKFAKKITKSKRCGNVGGGKTSKWTKNLRIMSDPTFHTKDLSLMILYWEK